LPRLADEEIVAPFMNQMFDATDGNRHLCPTASGWPLI